MIDNPLPNEIMSQNDEYYFSEQFYEHCKDKAIEIAVKLDIADLHLLMSKLIYQQKGLKR